MPTLFDMKATITLLLVLSAGPAVLLAADKTSAPEPTYADVAYGEHPNQVIDFWQADVDDPAPLVIYIHGGGFLGGSHKKVSGQRVQYLLNAGVHFASIEYRFLEHAYFPAAHDDAARALQFIRSKANEWNIDSDRIGGFGISAGAMLISYVAWADDKANPASVDPIARQSTRLKAVAPIVGQSTMNADWKKENIPGYTEAFYQTQAEVYRPPASMTEAELVAIGEELSSINHIGPNSPPTYMAYRMRPDDPPPSNKRQLRNWLIHHVNYGVAMEQRLKECGVEVHLKYPGAEVAFANEVDFLLHHLQN